MTHTEIQASVTKTATFTGSFVDVSALGAGWTIKLQVQKLLSGNICRLSFEDTPDGGTTVFTGPTWSFKGDIESSFDKIHSIKAQDFPDLSVGSAGNQIRLHLTNLSSPGSITYHAWMES